MTAQEGHATAEQYYKVTTPSGRVLTPPAGRCWGIAEATYRRLLDEGRIYFGKTGDSQPNIIRYLSEVPGVAPWSWWPSDEVGHTDESKKEIYGLFGRDAPFDSPKPERFLQRILHIATNPGDLVLDSFLGSGTTAAVAHKMGRRWIGIEMGEHARTHCLPRLQKVVEGEPGGISASVGWQGGGGFRFLTLGEPAFMADGCINPAVRFATLAGYLWFLDTGEPHADGVFTSPVLGVRGEGEGATAIALLYNGILGDRRPQGGNVLTSDVWRHLQTLLPAHQGRWVIYGEASRMAETRRREARIEFRQIPYDIRMR